MVAREKLVVVEKFAVPLYGVVRLVVYEKLAVLL